MHFQRIYCPQWKEKNSKIIYSDDLIESSSQVQIKHLDGVMDKLFF